MSIHKRGVRRLDLVDLSAVPAVLALRMSHEDRHDEKHEENPELQIWESEGGNPVPSVRRPRVDRHARR